MTAKATAPPAPKMGPREQAAAMRDEAAAMVRAAQFLAEGGPRRGRMIVEAAALRDLAAAVDRRSATLRAGDFADPDDFAEDYEARGFARAALSAAGAAVPPPRDGMGLREWEAVCNGWRRWQLTVGGAIARSLDYQEANEVEDEVEEIRSRVDELTESAAEGGTG